MMIPMFLLLPWFGRGLAELEGGMIAFFGYLSRDSSLLCNPLDGIVVAIVDAMMWVAEPIGGAVVEVVEWILNPVVWAIGRYVDYMAWVMNP